MNQSKQGVDNSLGQYSGGTFSELIKAYGFDRMDRDPKYRQDVHLATRLRRQKRREAERLAAERSA